MAIFFNWFGRKRSTPTIQTGEQTLTGSTQIAAGVTPVNDFSEACTISQYWCGIRLISETVAGLPLRTYSIDKNGNKTETTDHYLYQLLTFAPNKYQSRNDFWKSVVLNLVVSGNSYCKIIRSLGKIVSLLPVNSAQITPELLPNGDLHYTEVDANGNKIIHKSSDIFHVRGIGNGIVGMSPLEMAAQSLGIVKSIENRVGKLVTSAGKRSGIVTLDNEKIKQSEMAGIKDSLKKTIEGEEISVAPAGVNFHPLTLSATDMELLKHRAMSTETVARYLAVPPALLFDNSSTSSYGTALSELRQGFYSFNIRPYLENIEAAIVRQLLQQSEWGKVEFVFDFDALLRTDWQSRIQTLSQGIGAGIYTINQAKQIEGLPGIGPDGDKLLANGGLVPINFNQNNGENQ